MEWWAWCVLLALTGLLAACGAKPATTPEAEALLAKIPPPVVESQQAANTFLGTVAGSNFYIGLVIEGDTAVGYLCDGESDAWLTGKVEGDYLTLTSPDGATLKATLADNTIRGKVTLVGGDALDFTAAPQQGNEGLFRSKLAFGENQYVGGWIILEGGTRGFLRKIFGGKGNGGNAAPTMGPLDDCEIYQQDFNSHIAASNNTMLTAEQRQFATDVALQTLTDAGNFGCIIDPFGGGEQP
jgi:hypothetical protein